MMRVAGLDISTRNLDFVILDTDNPSGCEHRRVVLADRDGAWWETARGMRPKLLPMEANDFDPLSFENLMDDYEIELIGIERPYGPSRGSIASLHTILGAVLATIPQHITVLEVRPAEMRKALGAPGNGDKHTMYCRMPVEVMTRLGWNPGDSTAAKRDAENRLDAWAVAHAAWRMCENAAEKAA